MSDDRTIDHTAQGTSSDGDDDDGGGRWPSLPGAALIAACGFLAGALLALGAGALDGGGDQPQRIATRTVTVAVPATRTTGSTTIETTAVPELTGQPLDTARARVERASFEIDVEGGGVFGAIVDDNWEVVAQRPEAGEQLELGSSVQVVITRR
ncbi:MAG: PASTA domain-containing protein [Solirubrobacteraceae bacterium MAG38_C4-C5]|nr:PASTA domain-containing protein [Candidatus Siliceabacter maunaloa]